VALEEAEVTLDEAVCAGAAGREAAMAKADDQEDAPPAPVSARDDPELCVVTGAAAGAYATVDSLGAPM
jgi:hypothetical protein